MLKHLILPVILLSSTIAQAADLPAPPVAAKRPHMLTGVGGRTRVDNYYWLRDDTRKDPEMLAYLAAENDYADTVLAPTKSLQDRIYGEIVSRIKPDDASVPYAERGYLYYARFAAGADYPVVARRKGSMAAPEEVLLDEAAMAAGKGYLEIDGRAVSRDNRFLAFAEDIVGRRQYVLRVKDLATGTMLPDAVPDIQPSLMWSDDGRMIFYIEKDPVTLLSRRVKVHRLGTPASADKLVYEEPDDSFYIALGRTVDDRFLCISETSTVSNEARCAPADDPRVFTLVAPRRRDFRYEADHAGGRWVIRTDWNAPNYRLMQLKDGTPLGDRTRWSELVPASATVFIERAKPFDRFVAIQERADANMRLRILGADGTSRIVASDEPAYMMEIADNQEASSGALRYTYQSLATPPSVYDVDAASGRRTLLRRQPVPGYDPANYVTERAWVSARDGTRIPVSLLYRKGFRKDGTAALYQYGYGSYGASSDPEFDISAISFADRGLVYAIAHIRGGQEMGRAWYDQGHLFHKKNSFTDFIDVTRGLVAQGYVAKGRAAAEGLSAGGLLMAAVADMAAPDDYRAIIAEVPYVDVVTTMSDPTIPLTTNEYDEWGNPANAADYDYMLSYSPYDNVAAKAYPALFVGTALWDSQVQYYEPAKWVARLRATAIGTRPLVFRVNMEEGGHTGKSGRFRQYRDTAEHAAFALQQLGIDR